MNPLSPSSLRVSVQTHQAYLEAVLVGLASPAGASAALARIGFDARRTNAQRVLIDCTGILGQTAPADHQQLGAELALHLGGLRCALVTDAGKVRGVMGSVARTAGVDYQAFGNRDDALEWLTAQANGRLPCC